MSQHLANTIKWMVERILPGYGFVFLAEKPNSEEGMFVCMNVKRNIGQMMAKKLVIDIDRLNSDD